MNINVNPLIRRKISKTLDELMVWSSRQTYLIAGESKAAVKIKIAD